MRQSEKLIGENQPSVSRLASPIPPSSSSSSSLSSSSALLVLLLQEGLAACVCLFFPLSFLPPLCPRWAPARRLAISISSNQIGQTLLVDGGRPAGMELPVNGSPLPRGQGTGWVGQGS